MSQRELPVSPSELRQLLLQQQGLLRKQRGKNATLASIKQLGYVQLDSINVVARAHHHVLFNRVAGYQPEHIDELMASRQIFEYWSHAAAYLPMTDFRFSLYKKQQLQAGKKHWFAPDHQQMREVRARIHAEGPLKAADFSHEQAKNGVWWDWQPAKQALEQLFMQGELMVVRRDNFQKVFDLTERVLPAGVDVRVPNDEAMAEHLIETCLASHVIATAAQICYLRSGIKPAVQRVLQQQCESGALQSFRCHGQLYYAKPQCWDFNALSAKKAARVCLLSPFDNLLIQRQRFLHWFAMDYQMEVYVPAAKRQFGYYSLPILYGTNAMGLVDVKADRAKGELLLQQLHLNEHQPGTHGFARALAKALLEYAAFNRCQQVRLVQADVMTAAWYQKNVSPYLTTGADEALG